MRKAKPSEKPEEIEKLYIEPVSACNLRCNMCFRHNWIEEEAGVMPRPILTQLVTLARQLPRLKTVMLAGMGEPLLHPEIDALIRAFAEAGVRTELLTNGTLLTREKAEKLLDAGLSMLWMSVDGFDRESYEQVHIGSRFDLIRRNLEIFDEIRGSCALGITFVITRENRQQLERINAFADRYHANCINLSYAVPCTPVTPEDACYDAGYQIGKQYRVTGNTTFPQKRNHCTFIEENGCFIKWNGDVCPCMQLLHSSYSYYYAEKRKILGKAFGNITTRSLTEIWQQPSYAECRNRVRAFAFSDCTVCDGCEDRLENRTDCMYNDFPTCGACLWAQGIGRCP